MVLKPTRAGLTRAAQLVRGGGVVAFPTDTVFGLGAYWSVVGNKGEDVQAQSEIPITNGGAYTVTLKGPLDDATANVEDQKTFTVPVTVSDGAGGSNTANLTINVEDGDNGPRLNIAGDEAEILVRHRGEPLKALQHVVDMAYGRTLDDDRRVFVDALEYRKGKDIELRQMAKLLAEKVKQNGMDQQLGPLNPYERRIVHMAVAEISGATTESIGDAFSKTVLISVRK